MNILVLAATSFELNSVKEKIKSENFKGFSFSFFCTGIGNFETIFSLTKFLENSEKNFDFVLNFGICGYSEKISGSENFFQVGRIFGGAKSKEFLIPQFIKIGKIGSVFSSEKIIFEKEKIGEENFVEMESFGIEFVLEKYGIPRAYFKFPFDKIGSKDTKKFSEKLPEIKKILQENLDYEKLFLKIKKFLEKNTQKNFQKELLFLEKNFGNLTFQEKNIFEKLFFKYETLSGLKIFDLIKNSSEFDKKFLLEKINLEIEKYLI